MVSSAEQPTGLGKAPFFVAIGYAILLCLLSVSESAIQGPSLWAILLCASVVVLVSSLKLRSLWLGKGWTLPGTNSVVLVAVLFGNLLYLHFSH
jgi:hypothetical protein